MRIKEILSLLTLGLQAACAQSYEPDLQRPPVMERQPMQHNLDQLQASQPEVPGFAFAVIHNGRLETAATGVASPDQTAMTPLTPFRLASVTKTFVAAAILRLNEEGRIDLDAPIASFISSRHVELLRSDGYDPSAITIQHLLTHSGGLDDHFGSPAGIAAAFSDLDRQWTRTQQVALMIELTEPRGAPGQTFHYSDTGYVLLGEIIEKVTGNPLPDAVRQLNRFEALGLSALRWEAIDGHEQGAERAHQWIDGLDIHSVNGSIDAFGGGGLIGNVADTATYYDALFSGQIFRSDETLKLMQAAPSHPAGSPYRIGLFTEMIGGHQTYMHGGFWGVLALHVPSLNLTIAGVALDEAGEPDMRQFAFDIVRSKAIEARAAAD